MKLKEYSSAMKSLATGPWQDKNESGRIKWCVDTIEEFFTRGKLMHLLEKDSRRLVHGNPTQLEKELLPETPDEMRLIVDEFSRRQLQLLDVGSCYNPFKQYQRFEVTAVDIAPATEVSMS